MPYSTKRGAAAARLGRSGEDHDCGPGFRGRVGDAARAPVGPYAAIELKRGNTSYYFEYRAKRADRISDQDLQGPSAVVGIDWVGGSTAPTGRRLVHLMRKDVRLGRVFLNVVRACRVDASNASSGQPVEGVRGDWRRRQRRLRVFGRAWVPGRARGARPLTSQWHWPTAMARLSTSLGDS
jgi:hypothetical protein